MTSCFSAHLNKDSTKTGLLRNSCLLALCDILFAFSTFESKACQKQTSLDLNKCIENLTSNFLSICLVGPIVSAEFCEHLKQCETGMDLVSYLYSTGDPY